MFLKLLTPVLFFLVISTKSYCQDTGKTDSERQVDSLLQNFINERGNDPRFEEGVDSARLEQAENDYMDNFIKAQSDPRHRQLQKRTLQVFIGIIFLTGLFIVIRKRKYKGDGRSSRR